jgi:hypothetical protein
MRLPVQLVHILPLEVLIASYVSLAKTVLFQLQLLEKQLEVFVSPEIINLADLQHALHVQQTMNVPSKRRLWPAQFSITL